LISGGRHSCRVSPDRLNVRCLVSEVSAGDMIATRSPRNLSRDSSERYGVPVSGTRTNKRFTHALCGS